MPADNPFPEVDNWYREDPARDSQESNIWKNEERGEVLRTRRVNGPFGNHTSAVVLEQRGFADGSDWDDIDTFDTESDALRAAYEYAKENNEANE